MVCATIYTYMPRQNGRYHANDIFRSIVFSQKSCISIQISLKFVLEDPSDFKAKLVQVMAMMTSSNGNIFGVTGHLRGEFTGRRWIPRTKASDAELWYFLWSGSEWTAE